jgi:hypothetical protein
LADGTARLHECRAKEFFMDKTIELCANERRTDGTYQFEFEQNKDYDIKITVKDADSVSGKLYFKEVTIPKGEGTFLYFANMKTLGIVIPEQSSGISLTPMITGNSMRFRIVVTGNNLRC